MSSNCESKPEDIESIIASGVPLSIERCKVFSIKGNHYFVEIFRIPGLPKLFKVDIESGVEKSLLVVFSSSSKQHVAYFSQPVCKELEVELLEEIKQL